MNKLINRIVFFTFLFISIINSLYGQNVIVTGALVGNGSYATLSEAFSSINVNPQSETNINITIIGNTNEPVTGAILNNGSWNSLNISPAGGVARTVSSAVNAGSPLIDLNGASRVTINGLNTDGNSLSFVNTTISSVPETSTIRFINDASENSITNCSVLGSSVTVYSVSGGNILFSTGILIGNDNNVVSYCNLGPASTNFPTKSVSSSGTVSHDLVFNSNDTIRNCNIYDYFSSSISSAGVFMGEGSTNNVIINNRFYQTNARIHTAGVQHSAICIKNLMGNNFNISENIIGYSNSSGTGIYTLTAVTGTLMHLISVTAGNTEASSIQGNTIAKISMLGSYSGIDAAAPFRAISVIAGQVNIGNVSGNIIGSQFTKNNISITVGGSLTTEVNGIFIAGSSASSTNNNTIGGIFLSNINTGACRIFGIRNESSGQWNCENNIIGGTESSSIELRSFTTNCVAAGILHNGEGSYISGNLIRNITSNRGNIASGFLSTFTGIYINEDNYFQNVSGNVVHSLFANNSTQPYVISGIYFRGSFSSGTIERNFIHSINNMSKAAILNGIYANGGTAVYSNNMIRLGILPSGANLSIGCAINGINETDGINSFLFNSIYIGGNPVSDSAKTFAFKSSIVNNNRNCYNNIFSNERSNNGSIGKHYAISVGGSSPLPAGLQCNFNDLYANGVGSVIGLFNSTDRITLSEWKYATGKDSNSISADPKYVNKNGTSSDVDLHIDTNLSPAVSNIGMTGTGILFDYDNDNRSITFPDIGADEFVYTPVFMTLNLRMFIEGFYTPTIDSQVTDTVTIYLNNSSFPYISEDSSRSIVSAEGIITSKFSNAPDGNYYIVIRHRNSIETWSSFAETITRIIPTNYDFSIAGSQAYGNNLKVVNFSPVRYAIFSGDINQDGIVDETDNNAIDIDASNFETGYLSTDLNGDKVIDASDAVIADNNSANFVVAITP